MRAIEAENRSRALWTDADRAWASRAAAEVVGENAAPEAFLAQRAQLALARAGDRPDARALPRAVRALRWRPWVGITIVLVAFAAGLGIDQIGGTHRINVLAPPVLALLTWNLAVYLLLTAGWILRPGRSGAAGPLRRAVARLAGGTGSMRDGTDVGAALARLADDWFRLSTPLYSARAARILHLAAAALAAGVIAGLYLRGVALEYRASWESTFLGATAVHQMLALALAPGAALTGIPVPSAAELEAIRAPASENAARWLHLAAATVAAVVIAPRLALASIALLVERYRAARVPLSLDEPYFQRLLRGFRGGPARVRVVPYSYAAPSAVMTGLERLITRSFRGGAALTIAAPLAYGSESAPPAGAPPRHAWSTVIALFNASATPEPAAHGAALAAMSSETGRNAALVALVDESAFRAGPGQDPRRLEERRRAWRDVCAEQRVPCAFADLAGKTTLARTLLGRDVGEVRDAAHVTTVAARYTMIETPEGDSLLLWDTPGFGDSARLARRLAGQGNPIGWFLSQVWDRFRDRAFHLSQQAVRNVRDEADIVLYLVNASESPADAGYLASELDVLAWVGRPVFVLLNQTGQPRPPAAEEAEVARWREALGRKPFVREVLLLDAFARCWAQEFVLLAALGPAITENKRPAYDRLVDAWRERRRVQFDEAMAALARPIARAACDEETIPDEGFGNRLLGLLRAAFAGSRLGEERRRAALALAERFDAGLRDSTERLITIHGLAGRAAEEVRERLVGGMRTEAPLDEGKAAVMGSVLSGALAGLKADLAAGGLTLGAGTLLGALAGAAGGAGLARSINVLRGRTATRILWESEVLDTLVVAALLRYLAVAHYGRGRGEWQESEYPAFWQDVVRQAVASRRDALAALWARRADSRQAATIEPDLCTLLGETGLAVLDDLYPGALPAGAVPRGLPEQGYRARPD